MKKHRYLPITIAALTTFALVSGLGSGGASAVPATHTRATPYPAWTQPTIDPTLSVAQAKQLVARATARAIMWTGPTTGPRAVTTPQHLAYVSSDQSYVSYVLWGDGVQQAAKVLGWTVTVFDGKGTVSGIQTAMESAVAMKPTAIITSADVSALQKPIKQAVAEGIPVIGIHGTAFAGPSPTLNLFDNIASNPALIGQIEAAYVIAASNGTARDIHTLDTEYAIARFKAKATEEPIEHLKSATFLEQVNIPVAEESSLIPSIISGIVARYGTKNLYITTCCDDFYTYMAAALRDAHVGYGQVKLVGADGPPSAYEMIRKGEYEVATQPEPSTLFGYMAVDAIVRAMAGQPPAKYIPPVHLTTKQNVNEDGGSTNQFIPSNNFACYYANIWLGKHVNCSATK